MNFEDAFELIAAYSPKVHHPLNRRGAEGGASEFKR